MEDLEQRINHLEKSIARIEQHLNLSSKETDKTAIPEEIYKLLGETKTLIKKIEGSLSQPFMLNARGGSKDFPAQAQLTWWANLKEENVEDTARLALTLGSPQRLKILKFLYCCQRNVKELKEEIKLEGGPLYHHLRDLRTGNLIKQGENKKYTLTEYGRDALFTILSMHRRFTYSNPLFWKEEKNLEEK